MEKVLCPYCGQPMKKTAMTETLKDGTRIVIYACPNRSGCGAIIKRNE